MHPVLLAGLQGGAVGAIAGATQDVSEILILLTQQATAQRHKGLRAWADGIKIRYPRFGIGAVYVDRHIGPADPNETMCLSRCHASGRHISHEPSCTNFGKPYLVQAAVMTADGPRLVAI